MKNKQHFLFQWALIAFFGLLPFLGFAQQKEFKDPMKKPHIWSKLKANPADDELWAEYMGKPVDELNDSDQNKFREWKTSLMASSTPKTSVQVEAPPIENAQQLKGWEDMIMEDSREITTLKSNINANFMLIEELFAGLFSELEMEYRPYNEVYPKKNYPPTKWVEEHENKIKDAKEKKLAEYKKRYNIKN